MELTITHDAVAQQFSAIVEGKQSFISYEISPDKKVLDFYSTFVPPELRGRHIGDTLVKHALEYAKDHQQKVIPSCPFVQHYIDRHPDYLAIVF